MKLGDISDVRSGLVLSRKKSKTNEGIAYKALNFKAIAPEGYINEDELDVFISDNVLPPDYVSHTGDIVVRLTAPYTAVLIDETTEGIVISSNFLIIRNIRREILPEYLLWLLNTKKIKNDIYGNTTSNMLGAVKARYYIDLNIAPISIEKQKLVSEINLLSKKESSLLKKLAEEKAKYYAAILDNLQREGN